MQKLRDKLVQSGVVPEDYRPGESRETRADRRTRPPRETARALRAIVAPGVVPVSGDRIFFFSTRSGKLRRLFVSEDDERRLQAGELAVVDRPGHPTFPWAVVPRAAAEKMLAIAPKAVRFYVRSEREAIGATR